MMVSLNHMSTPTLSLGNDSITRSTLLLATKGWNSTLQARYIMTRWFSGKQQTPPVIHITMPEFSFPE